MKRSVFQRDELASLLFGLTDKSVDFRNRWRMAAGVILWLVLSGLTMLLNVFFAEQPIHRAVIVVMSFVKYVPLLYVVYEAAKQRAAYYLDDIFELQNESLAANFIEEVAFGGGYENITINEGKISPEDEQSPIILIGGPGNIQVNLGSAALLEQLDGDPEVIYARSKPWKLGRFEHIREIGKYDAVGKREYAVINLRDQFVGGLSVKARTKDGILIEALDIKVIFSILRKQPARYDQVEPDPYSFEEKAVRALVYDQTIITPPPASATGVGFPWDTSVIPLVIYEIEKLITSRTLSEILTSISQREIDTITKSEDANAQMRVEMTGEHTTANKGNPLSLPHFEQRSKITAIFFSDAFKEKAANMGITIQWIDIGTWQLPSGTILENLKQAWALARENAKRRGALERSAQKHEMDGLLELVRSVIIVNFEKTTESRRLSERETLELAKMIENNPEVAASPLLFRQLTQHSASKRDANTIALEILKAIRKELIAGMDLIEKENKPEPEKKADLIKIERALHEIDQHVFRYIKPPSTSR